MYLKINEKLEQITLLRWCNITVFQSAQEITIPRLEVIEMGVFENIIGLLTKYLAQDRVGNH